MTFNIAALHGGGMLGKMTLDFFELLERETGGAVAEMYDIIGGDSTGAIIAAGYAAGLSTTDMINLYKDMRDRIFGKKRGFLGSLFNPVFDIDNLYGCLKDIFGDKRLGDAVVPIMVHAVQYEKGQVYKTKFWKSWRTEDQDVLLADICCASSALPGGFAPWKIGDHYYIDGGLATNNPSMNVLADVRRLHGSDTVANTVVTSMWTEEYPPQTAATKLKGLLRVYPNLPGIFLQAGEDTVDYQAKTFAKALIDVRPEASFTIDSNEYAAMRVAAEAQFKEHGGRVAQYLKG